MKDEQGTFADTAFSFRIIVTLIEREIGRINS